MMATPARDGSDTAPAPLLSIVIPVLNAARDLPACLKAVDKQSASRRLFEVIAVDGGSTDETRKIATDAGARIVANPYREAEPGVAVGIQAAHGQLVMVIAADNWMRGIDFIERMIEPFDEPEVMAAFPRVVSTKDDCLPTRYVNRYTDPFTHFVYGSARTSFDVMMGRSSVPDGRRFATLTPSAKYHPLLALAQGCTIRRRAFQRPPERADDVMSIVDIIQSGGKLALVQDAELEHHMMAGLRSFYRKYRYRVGVALQPRQGYLHRRPSLSRGNRIRAWLWLPYSATVVPSVLHGVAMSIRRRDPLLLYHPVLNTVLLAAVCREAAARGRETVAAVRKRRD
jgi:glycosyltransferase involved in cell wall biosynthesis